MCLKHVIVKRQLSRSEYAYSFQTMKISIRLVPRHIYPQKFASGHHESGPETYSVQKGEMLKRLRMFKNKTLERTRRAL